MVMHSYYNVPVVVSHVIDSRNTLYSRLIIPTAVYISKRCRYGLVDSCKQTARSDLKCFISILEITCAVSNLTISPRLVIRNRNVMFHIACLGMSHAAKLPVIEFLRCHTGLSSHIKSAVLSQRISAAAVCHHMTVQIISLHTEIEEHIEIIIQFLFMVIGHEPAVGSLYHAVKAEVGRSFRYSR